MTVRTELERRVDALAARYSGEEFAAAVKELHDGLDRDGREQLKEIVMARAASVDEALMDRVDARGWLRRQWDRATGPSPHGNDTSR